MSDEFEWTHGILQRMLRGNLKGLGGEGVRVVKGLGVSLGGKNTFYCVRRLICDVMGQGGQREWKSGRHYERGAEG